MAATGFRALQVNDSAGVGLVNNISPGRLVAFNVTTAGNVVFHMQDGTNFVRPVTVGYYEVEYAVKRILTTGTTAVVDSNGYRNLY